MRIDEHNFFELLLDKYSNHVGYLLINILDEKYLCTVYEFETKEEFDKHFITKRHAYYPSDVYIPRIINNTYGEFSWDFEIYGTEYHIDGNNLYLLINGELQKY